MRQGVNLILVTHKWVFVSVILLLV